ncbi:hypothetical protein RQP46_002024 [Phenoliferia psychrophenolica]
MGEEADFFSPTSPGGRVDELVRQARRWWFGRRKLKPGLTRRAIPACRSRRVLFGLAALALLLYAIFRRRSTLVLSSDEVASVWQWELASGRYPSRRPSRWSLQELRGSVDNPGLPTSASSTGTGVRGVGHPRTYLRVPRRPTYDASKSTSPPSPYPPRPTPNSAIDLDVVMDHCDFSASKYVRDCLHVLRVNAGMDKGARVESQDLRHSFQPSKGRHPVPGGAPNPRELEILEFATRDMSTLLAVHNDTVFSALADIRLRAELSSPASFPTVPPTPPHPTHPTADPSCDPAQPRIFHIYWAGPFTDKPYAAALSFLYTQRLGLSLPIDSPPVQGVCRPQLWFWINPGPASSLPDAHAMTKMKETLVANEWSAPLLNRRFRDAIHFKLWNSTEQLNAIPEMKGWDSMGFFKSGGVKYKQQAAKKSGTPRKVPEESAPPEAPSTVAEGRPAEVGEEELSRFGRAALVVDAEPESVSHGEPAPTKLSAEDELFNRVGSAAESDYDRLSVILSDMARFVLTYRYGGIYLDADTLFLRDWEEVWGWHGAFGYRWSRLKVYNTAVLKMARGSALGSAIIKTAFRNGLDFHPMVVSRYLKEMRMEELLLRLPDALFDPAWLNVENYQRDRPAFPLFQSFKDFFVPPIEFNAAPAAVGMVGFFRGAFSYHFHNYWWLPFDPSRNFPDLGSRFLAEGQVPPLPTSSEDDLSWSTVLKRTFEKFVRGEAPNLYGEDLNWEEQ